MCVSVCVRENRRDREKEREKFELRKQVALQNVSTMNVRSVTKIREKIIRICHMIIENCRSLS